MGFIQGFAALLVWIGLGSVLTVLQSIINAASQP